MPVRSTPSTIQRCRKRNISNNGAMATSAAAKGGTGSTDCAVRKVDRAICTVQVVCSRPMTSGQRKAFQEPMKVIVPMAAAKPYEFRHDDPPGRSPVAEPVQEGRLLISLGEAEEELAEEEGPPRPGRDRG